MNDVRKSIYLDSSKLMSRSKDKNEQPTRPEHTVLVHLQSDPSVNLLEGRGNLANSEGFKTKLTSCRRRAGSLLSDGPPTTLTRTNTWFLSTDKLSMMIAL